MAERRSSYRDGDRAAAGEPGRHWRPPRAQTHGGGSVSVPLWEKKFCTDACSIPWGKLCETKKLMSMYTNIVDWDDSAAFEAFRDAKNRYYAVYHGQPCDIPLPDPNMYIDVVNLDEYLDPELVADLERSRRSLPRRDTTTAPNGWDSFIFTNKPVPATGWGDGETTHTLGQQCSVNWDNYVEQPVEANFKQGSGNWDNYASQPAETFVQQGSGNWDMYVEQQGPTSSWGAPIMPGTSNWDMNVDAQHAWNHDNYGWGSAAVGTDSWDNQKDSYCAPDSQAQGSSYGHWRRRNNESGRRNSRNRDRGGPISSKAMKSKYQADEHSNSWRHCRVRDSMHYSYEQPGYTNQSLAM
ncbi:unnamed protein product [Alopecurus aequalis]